MKKQGFTLLEVTVSVVLVSVVMVSLLASLVQLRNTYTVIHENSDIIVYSSSVSRVINNDLALNNGIRYVTCDSDGQSCDLILGNDGKRRLEIIKKEVLDPSYPTATHTNIKTTLKYIDTSIPSDEKLIYIRTLESDRYENAGTVTTKGYNFADMSASWVEYTENDSADALIDQYTTVLIKLNNLENEDLSKYDITLITAGRYDYSNLLGKTYTLELNNAGAEIAGTTRIDEVFGVGYFKSDEAHSASKQLNATNRIDVPKNGTKAFLGYYYIPAGSTQSIQIINSQGIVIASSKFFRNDVDINLDEDADKDIIIAKWGECIGEYEIVDGTCQPIG